MMLFQYTYRQSEKSIFFNDDAFFVNLKEYQALIVKKMGKSCCLNNIKRNALNDMVLDIYSN